MRRLSQRGSVSMMFGLAAVPLIGFAALGTEAGVWYVTKRQAQNAADASAYAGALALAAGGSSGSATSSATNVAKADGFCNNGAGGCSRTNQTVSIATTASSVTATVQQQETAALSAVLKLAPFNIVAQATASIITGGPLCMLATSPSSTALTLGGNQSITGGGCSLMSDGGIKENSPPTLSSGTSLLSVSGCKGQTGSCSSVLAMAPAYNPLSALDQISALQTPSSSPQADPCKKGCSGTTINPGSYSGLTLSNGNSVTLSPGTYFFDNAAIKITGGTLTGNGVNIVMRGSSTLNINGAQINLTAATNNATYPQLDGVLVYDANPQVTNVNITGSPTSTYGGAMYFPNGNVTWGGNAGSTMKCTEVIASTLTTQGTNDINIDTSGCPSSIIPTTKIVLLTN